MLYASSRDAPVAVSADAVLRGALNAAFGSGIDYYSEHMDVYRFGEPDYETSFREYLRGRYATHRFDVVIAPSTRALRVLRHEKEHLFPNSPLVFHGRKGEPADPLSTGVVSETDMTRTLDLALDIHPDTTRVVVVGGSSAVDRSLAERARSQFRAFEGRIAFTYLFDRTMAELRQTLAHLPTTSIIFYVSIGQDAEGRHLVPAAALEELALVASAPIYCYHDILVGYGAVGGRLESTNAAMRKLAEIAARILRGEAAASIPVSDIDVYVDRFDGRQLKRWGISEGRLPPGSTVLFRNPGISTQYRPYVVGSGIAGIAGGTFLALWVVERRRRIKGAGEARSHLSAMAQMERRASLGQLTASLAHELGQPIATILRNAEAAKMILAADHPKLHKLEEIVEDIRRSDRRAYELIQRLRTMLQKHEVQFDAVDLNRVVGDVEALVAPLLAEQGASLQTVRQLEPCVVLGDAVHLEQAVLNLVLNSIDALARTPRASRHLNVSVYSDGADVGVTVTDRGSGLTAEALDRAFDPFFSTKPDGLGMGLSIVRNIIQAHGGRVAVANHDQGGAVVTVVLPRAHTGKAAHHGARTV